jgi:hypothetical protein
MKRFFASFLSLSLILAACSLFQPTATATPTPPTHNSDILDTPWEDRAPFKDGLISSEQSVLTGLSGASVYHLEFNIAKDLFTSPATRRFYTNTEECAG